jgi:hypothetical protein
MKIEIEMEIRRAVIDGEYLKSPIFFDDNLITL